MTMKARSEAAVNLADETIKIRAYANPGIPVEAPANHLILHWLAWLPGFILTVAIVSIQGFESLSTGLKW